MTDPSDVNKPTANWAAPTLLATDVEAFVQELLAPARTRPVVAISTWPADRGFPIDPGALARTLGDRARVVGIRTGDDTWALSEALPKRLDVYGGATRIWWPGLSAGSDPYDHPLLFAFTPADASAVVRRIVAAICDGCHTAISHFIKPGMQEHQITAFAMNFLYNIPGIEDVEDIIVSSGPNSWPNWRHFSDRIIQPGDLVIIDMAAVTWNGYKSCMYRTYCVGKKPTQEQKDYYNIAYEWLYRAIDKVTPGATTKEIAECWPSAMDTWGYKEEDQAAANLWGHGLGLAQYDTPVISRIYSLDFPVVIQPGMSFALETQHGKPLQWGVRLEEMMVVTEKGPEVTTQFPIEEITVID